MTDDSPRRRFGDLTAAQVAALDAAATAAGVDVLQLMEVAGFQVARCAWAMLERRPGHVAVVAGRGNNGGDGLVAARHLAAWGCTVRCLVVGEESRLSGLLHTQLAAAAGSGAAVSTGDAAASSLLDGAQLVIDALLGTGLRSAPHDPDASAIRALANARVLAVDVPSGLDSSTGEAFTPCVVAECTCTLTAVKSGLWTESGRTHAGRLVVADIGMPMTAWHAIGVDPPTLVRGGALLSIPSGAPAGSPSSGRPPIRGASDRL